MSYLDELFSLRGKTAIITGGGRGIGQVVALGLSKAYADIVILSRSDASQTIKLINDNGGKCCHIKCDVTNEKEVDKSLDKILHDSGSIDILFNNAGICIHKSTFETSIEEFRQVIETNLIGQFIMARAVGKIMVDRKIKGNIINMASMSGSIVNIPQWQCSYNSSKAAVIHMTKSLAIEWADYGIRVNSISPGYIGTPMSADTPKELKDKWMPLIPYHRMGKPEELMPAILYLCSNSSSYATGSDIIVDGGYVCV